MRARDCNGRRAFVKVCVVVKNGLSASRNHLPRVETYGRFIYHCATRVSNSPSIFLSSITITIIISRLWYYYYYSISVVCNVRMSSYTNNIARRRAYYYYYTRCNIHFGDDVKIWIRNAFYIITVKRGENLSIIFFYTRVYYSLYIYKYKYVVCSLRGYRFNTCL